MFLRRPDEIKEESVEKKTENRFVFFNSINQSKHDISNEFSNAELNKLYNCFYADRYYSAFIDDIPHLHKFYMYNTAHMSNKTHYKFLLHSLPSGFRQNKKDDDGIISKYKEKVKIIADYFYISEREASEYVDLYTDERVKEMKKVMNDNSVYGGVD